jgi:hypothetical protein
MTDNKTRIQTQIVTTNRHKCILNLTTNGVGVADSMKFVQRSKEKTSYVY